jgi:hypothetical protein
MTRTAATAMTAQAVGLSPVVVLVVVVDVLVLVPAVTAGLGAWPWVVVVVELLFESGAAVGGSSATTYSMFISLGHACYALVMPAHRAVKTSF